MAEASPAVTLPAVVEELLSEMASAVRESARGAGRGRGRQRVGVCGAGPGLGTAGNGNRGGRAGGLPSPQA